MNSWVLILKRGTNNQKHKSKVKKMYAYHSLIVFSLQSSVFTCSECFFHLGNSQSRLKNHPTILLFNCARLKVFTLYIAVSYLLIKGYLLTFSSWFNVRRHLSSAFLDETRVPWRNKHFSFFLGRTCDHFSLVALCFLFYYYYYY